MKMATGEIIGAEELGGATVHGTLTGLADQIAVDEFVFLCSPLRVVITDGGVDLMHCEKLGNGLVR